MSDQVSCLLNALESIIKLVRLRDEQLKVELDRVAHLQAKLHRQWEVNNKLLNERNALRNKLALITLDDYFEEKD